MVATSKRQHKHTAAIFQYAQTLCKLEPIPKEKIDYLFNFLPQLNDQLLQTQSPKHRNRILTTLLGVRSQEALDAVGYFLVESNGTYIEKILPTLLVYLDFLPKAFLNVEIGQHSALYSDCADFVSTLLIQLGKIARSIESSKPQIVPKVVEFYNSVLSIGGCVIEGCYVAFGHSLFPFYDTKQVTKLVEGMNPKIEESKLQVLILNTMRRLTYLPQGVCSVQHFEYFFSVVQQFIQARETSQSKYTFAAAIDLATACGLNEVSLTDRVVIFLKAFFTEYFQAPKQIENIYSDEAIEEYKCSLRGLTDIAVKFENKIGGIISMIIDTIYDSSQLTYTLKQYSILRDAAIEALCKILKRKFDQDNDISLINAVFTTNIYTKFYLTHKKYTKYLDENNGQAFESTSSRYGTMKEKQLGQNSKLIEKYKRNAALMKNIILLIGKIAQTLNDSKVTALILSPLISRIHYPPGDVDTLLIEQLTDLCLLGQEAAYNDIIVEFINIFKRTVKDTEKRNITHMIMPNAFLTLGSNLPSSLTKIRANLLQRIMKLFSQLGKGITSPAERTLSSPVMQGMGYLLPIIAELVKDHTNTAILDPDPEGNVTKLFRTVWFFCVLFKFVEREAWRSDWYESARRVAHKIPVLISKTPVYEKKLELEIESLLQNGFTEKEVNSQYKLLVGFLPEQSGYIKNFSRAQVLYVLSIYYLESLRANSGIFQTIFAYMEDAGLSGKENEGIIECIKGIADKVFPIFLEYMNTTMIDKREEILENETEALMMKYCSHSLTARKVADRCIISMAESFPQICWNRKCLQTLLELIDTVGKACDLTMVGIVKLPHSTNKLELPDAQKDRQDLLRDLIKLATRYIKYGILIAPQQTHSILQEYHRQFKEHSAGFLEHIGFSLAIELCSLSVDRLAKEFTASSKEKVIPDKFPPAVSSYSSNYVQGLELKSLYTGEIKGLLELLNDSNKNSRQALEFTFIQQLSSLIKGYKAGRAIDLNLLRNVMYRSAALLISQNLEHPINQHLVHMICWAPVIIFTQESLQIAVSVWTWLLAAKPNICMNVMSEIYEAWAWTVDSRIGLFSNAPRKASPLSITKVSKEEVHELSEGGATPHRIWIEFLSEQYIIRKYGSVGGVGMRILVKMMQKALANPNALSIQPSSLCVRFRLLLLCLRILHTSAIQDNLLETLLRERLYQSALTWFFHQPSFFNPHNRKLLEEDIQVLISFNKELQAEDAYDKRIERLSTVNIYLEENEKPPEIFVIRDLKRTRKLIILLVGNEIDRIIAWTNPNNRVALQIPEQDIFSTVKVSNVKDFMRIAWDISPQLALHMATRFPNSKTVGAVIERKVKEQPWAVVDIPEAFNFLVTEHNVQNNIPELKYLLYWCNVTPPNALLLLEKRFNSHPLVIQYAVRVLHSFPPETIIFYIPQLVQTLRYDKTGLVFEYLAIAAKESDLLAHQIIWNTQTYTEVEEPGELGVIARQLQQRIMNEFDEKAAQSYNTEFNFFSTVTSISGFLLHNAETKEARKPLLIQELRKLPKPPPEVYLPTNPDTIVHGIVPEKATSLQSAAKAPILVTFECHPRDEEVQVEEEEMQVSEGNAVIVHRKKVVWNTTFQRSCIFKEGDDIRQDMLAIQIIDLFKKIFRSVDLDLYVYPYKIIATKPGCGIMECVPNAMSRDQLGKKVEGGLFEYFQSKYGSPNTEAFQEARKNFIKSLAAYGVVCFILQVKDRHNGNILIDEEGHMVHIDFGFIFEISPGGDIGFEVAPFKLSTEMISILGGRPDAEPFKWFMELGVKAFLACRYYARDIMTLVELMLDTQLPCFKPLTMEHLRQRLASEKTEKAAAKYMTERIVQSFSNISAITTYFYDLFQNISQGIDY